MSAAAETLSPCPKCARARPPGAEACPRCGLVFARWAGDPTAAAPALDEEGARLFAELGSHWQDEARHDAFLKRCSSRGQLVVAGRLYRERLDSDPSDVIAARMQQRIIAMATATLAPIAQPGRRPVTRGAMFWWIIIGAAVAGGLGALLMRR